MVLRIVHTINTLCSPYSCFNFLQQPSLQFSMHERSSVDDVGLHVVYSLTGQQQARDTSIGRE